MNLLRLGLRLSIRWFAGLGCGSRFALTAVQLASYLVDPASSHMLVSLGYKIWVITLSKQFDLDRYPFFLLRYKTLLLNIFWFKELP